MGVGGRVIQDLETGSHVGKVTKFVVWDTRLSAHSVESTCYHMQGPRLMPLDPTYSGGGASQGCKYLFLPISSFPIDFYLYVSIQ